MTTTIQPDPLREVLRCLDAADATGCAVTFEGIYVTALLDALVSLRAEKPVKATAEVPSADQPTPNRRGRPKSDVSAKRKAEAQALYATGVPMAQIARQLGVGNSAVSRYIHGRSVGEARR